MTLMKLFSTRSLNKFRKNSLNRHVEYDFICGNELEQLYLFFIFLKNLFYFFKYFIYLFILERGREG